MENHGREKGLSKFFRIINSAFCFASAYLFIHTLHWAIVGLIGASFDLNAKVYYHGVKFLMTGHKWDRQVVLLTYGTAPLVILVIGLLSIFVFSYTKSFKTIVNLFLLWLFVVAVGMFLSQGIVSSLGVSRPESGFPFYIDWAAVFAWLNIPPFMVYALNVPFIVLILYFGANTARPFLLFAYSYTKLNKLERRRRYFVEIAIVPFIIGGFITLLVGYPFTTTYFAEDFIVHGVYLLTIGAMLGTAYVALPYINVTREQILKYVNLQAANIFAFFGLILIVIAIKVAWNGISL